MSSHPSLRPGRRLAPAVRSGVPVEPVFGSMGCQFVEVG
jgi:hypothetical protein